MSFALTPAQAKAMRFIQGYVARTGFGPNFDEIADALDLSSKSGVHRLLTALQERGYIRRRRAEARAIEIVKPLPDIPADRADRIARAVCDALRVSSKVDVALVRTVVEKELGS